MHDNADYDKGDHPHLSEHWLLDNLPDGWSYDCIPFGPKPAFIITATDGKTLHIPIRLLR